MFEPEVDITDDISGEEIELEDFNEDFNEDEPGYEETFLDADTTNAEADSGFNIDELTKRIDELRNQEYELDRSGSVHTDLILKRRFLMAIFGKELNTGSGAFSNKRFIDDIEVVHDKGKVTVKYEGKVVYRTNARGEINELKQVSNALPRFKSALREAQSKTYLERQSRSQAIEQLRVDANTATIEFVQATESFARTSQRGVQADSGFLPTEFDVREYRGLARFDADEVMQTDSEPPGFADDKIKALETTRDFWKNLAEPDRMADQRVV